MSVPLSDTRLTEAAKRALTALEDLIAESRDPGVEALGARYELAHALGQVSANELPLDEEGFSSQRMEAENFRKLFHSSRDRADNLAERVAELQDELAAARTEPSQPSAEHQAIYLDDYDQVWCDYPTVPADDQVLPLVWASEVAQSRRDLADGGNKLRVIGWCR